MRMETLQTRLLRLTPGVIKRDDRCDTEGTTGNKQYSAR